MPSDGPNAARTPSRWSPWAIAAVGIAALASFAYDLPAEPSFADEWAYIAQAYYGPLWWGGAWDDPAWLEYGAVDLPPLPKYLIAGMIRLGGRPMPGRADANAWYLDTSATSGGPDLLVWSRWPMVALGAVGCMAAAAIGTMAFGPRVGVLAGLLLAIDPLYRVHARRAMSDVPTEAFTVLTLAVGLWAWRGVLSGARPWRSSAMLGVGAGILAGLAVLAKLSGGLAVMTLVAWAALAIALPGVAIGRKLAVVAATGAAGLVSYATFVAGNPALTADPVARPTSAYLAVDGLVPRTRAVLKHRDDVSRAAQENGRFKSQGYALTDPASKVAVVAVQGFGRFGPLGPSSTDSLRRYDAEQDWGAALWGPLVLVGIAWAGRDGLLQRRSGEAPTAWAVLAAFGVAMATVTAFIPLAWDRYMLPIQSGAAILASGAISGAYGAVLRVLNAGEGRRA